MEDVVYLKEEIIINGGGYVYVIFYAKLLILFHTPKSVRFFNFSG